MAYDPNDIKISLDPGQLAFVKRALKRRQRHTGEGRITISAYFRALVEREQRNREMSQKLATSPEHSDDSHEGFFSEPPRPLP